MKEFSKKQKRSKLCTIIKVILKRYKNSLLLFFIALEIIVFLYFLVELLYNNTNLFELMFSCDKQTMISEKGVQLTYILFAIIVTVVLDACLICLICIVIVIYYIVRFLAKLPKNIYKIKSNILKIGNIKINISRKISLEKRALFEEIKNELNK